jgi:hypothetical protein
MAPVDPRTGVWSFDEFLAIGGPNRKADLLDMLES